MAKLKTLQSALNAGELNPLLRGRMDVARYANGLELCRNALPLVGGGVTRRMGSRHVVRAVGAEVLLFPFIIAESGKQIGYMLEFGDGVIRVCDSQKRQITDGAGNPVQIVSPYGAAQLHRVQYEMFEDAMYLWHPEVPTQKLTRTSDTDWTLQPFVFTSTPFFRAKETKEITIAPSGTGGEITLTASADLFTAEHVGVRFMVNAGVFEVSAVTDARTVTATTVERIVVPNQMRRITYTVSLDIDPALMTGSETLSYEFKTERLDTAATLQLETEQDLPPNEPGLTFSLNSVLDTIGGKEIHYDTVTVEIDPATLGGPRQVDIVVRAQMQDFEKIIYDSYYDSDTETLESTTSTQVTINFDLNLIGGPADPAGVVKSSTKNSERINGTEADTLWKEECWSPVRGYPAAGTFHDQRMVLGFTESQPTAIWGSKIGEMDDFETGTLDDEAFAFTLTAARDGVRHLVSGDRLLAFTGTRELALNTSDGGPLSPTNPPQVKHLTSHGCSTNVRPILLGQDTYFTTASGRELRGMSYRIEIDGMRAPDLGLLSGLPEAGGGIVDMAFSRGKHPTVWIVTAAGNLLSLTLDPDQEVTAWARHETNEATVYKSVTVIPDENGEDQVWIAVQRQIGGAAVTLIEVLDEALNTDSAATATNTDTIALPHLDGETVHLVADGYVLRSQKVENGQVNVGWVVETIEAGLPYTHTIKDLPPYIQGGAGASASCNQTMVLLHQSKACSLDGYELDFRAFGEGVLDTPVQSFTGWKDLNRITGWEFDGSTMQVEISSDQPLPLTVLAIVKEVSVNGG